jgi:hypothetical protein
MFTFGIGESLGYALRVKVAENYPKRVSALVEALDVPFRLKVKVSKLSK